MTNEELALEAQKGDRQAVGSLWEQVKGLLYQLARRFYARAGAACCASHGVALADLEQECYFALLDAVKAYKPSGGYRFTTYLSRASENRFKAAMGLHKVNPLDRADSLNAPAFEEGEAGDLLPDPRATAQLDEVEAALAAPSCGRALKAALGALPPVQGAILRRRYYGRQTRQQTAAALHITPVDVRREEAKALQALRGDSRITALEYLEGAAYQGTGWNAWYYHQGSVEERLAERR